MAPNNAALIWDTSSDRSRKAGIRWNRTEGEIDRLNAIVIQKMGELVEESKKTGQPLSPEVEAVLKNPGNTVYKKRWVLLPILYAACSLGFIIFGGAIGGMQTPVTIMITFIFSFLWYDLFSGVLHVNLDNPDFIGFPILHEPCLEFQWHHHIPMDLTVKSYLEVCGDLNMVVTILFAVYFCLGLVNGMNPTYCCLVGWKLLMAYFGQLCHCMSHMPLPYVPKWILALQNAGVMISTKEHNGHHKTYDDNFCIGSGMCNPIIAGLRRITSNKWLWLSLFIFTLIADVPLANYVLTSKLGFQ